MEEQWEATETLSAGGQQVVTDEGEMQTARLPGDSSPSIRKMCGGCVSLSSLSSWTVSGTSVVDSGTL